jgi:hypothetical protein
MASLMLSLLLRGIGQMKVKQSLIAALGGIAMMIAMPIAVAAGAVILVGHLDGWGRQERHNAGLVWDEDGDGCQAAVQSDEGGDCRSSMWSDYGEDDCEPSAGYEGQY